MFAALREGGLRWPVVYTNQNKQHDEHMGSAIVLQLSASRGYNSVAMLNSGMSAASC